MVCIRHYTVHIRLSCILIALTFYIDSIIIIIVVDISGGGGYGCGCGRCTGLSAILLNCSIVSTFNSLNIQQAAQIVDIQFNFNENEKERRKWIDFTLLCFAFYKTNL